MAVTEDETRPTSFWDKPYMPYVVTAVIIGVAIVIGIWLAILEAHKSERPPPKPAKSEMR